MASNNSRYVNKMKRFKAEDADDRNFKIGQEIEAVGMIKYLKLDDPKMVKLLNAKYHNKKQGINLLLELVYKRHEGEYP
jgi:hypothetical protein